MFQLASPEQSGKADETGSIIAELDSLKGREEELQSELRDIFIKKSDAQKRLQEVVKALAFLKIFLLFLASILKQAFFV